MKITKLNHDNLKLVTEISFDIDKNEIYRLSGVKGENKKMSPKLEQIIDEKINQAQNLIVPKALYVIKDVAEVDDEKVFFKDESHIRVKSFRKFISSIEKMAIALCTLGKLIDEEISDLNHKGSYTEALILDIIGSVAVEDIANKINFLVCEKAERIGLRASQRFSPGYGNFDLSEQENIFRILNAGEIDVSLTKSYMMVPKKTISFCLYLGKLKDNIPDLCTVCGLKNCRFKRT